MKTYTCHYKSPVGLLEISATDEFLIGLTFVKKGSKSDKSKVIDLTIAQLEQYFNGKRKEFTIPLYYEGAIFQRKVWDEILKVPYGQTISYKQLATNAGSPNAFRAAGTSCGKNKIAIIIPCHRILATNGFGNYAFGIEIKQTLLNLEALNA